MASIKALIPSKRIVKHLGYIALLGMNRVALMVLIFLLVLLCHGSTKRNLNHVHGRPYSSPSPKSVHILCEQVDVFVPGELYSLVYTCSKRGNFFVVDDRVIWFKCVLQ